MSIRERVEARAGRRCGYCQAHQDNVLGRLELEHIIPKSRGGASDEANLWLSCGLCNRFKGDRVAATDPETSDVVPLFHPGREKWNEHFQWEGPIVVGLTPRGRATVAALQMNNSISVTVRRRWMTVRWHPPEIADEEYL